MSCRLITNGNVRKFIESFDTVLTDCDGVLWNGSIPIPGASLVIKKLQDLGKTIFYITNNSTKSRREYVQKCTTLGFPADEDHFIGSAYVAANYIKNHLHYDGTVFVVGSTGIKHELEEVNLKCIGVGPDHIGDLQPSDIPALDTDPQVKCVVVGLDAHFSYLKMARALGYLQQNGCHFIATNNDPALPVGNGTILPGTGSILAAMETAAGRPPDVICGKPFAPVYDVLAGMHDLEPSRTLMIGDRLSTDIQLAGNCDLLSLLVLTGISSPDDVQRLQQQQANSSSDKDQQHIPNYYLPSLVDLNKLMLEVGL